MSEPKTTGALVTAEVTWVSPVEYVEIRAALARSRAREKRLEGMALALVSSVLDGDRWWTMRRKDVEVDAKNLRAALSEET